MAVHHVQQDPDVHPVRFVHQVFQVVRCAVPVRRREKIGHLVTEGAVIGMLLNRHQLDGVVPQIPDAGQHVVRKLPVGTDAFLILAHADMGFVDQRRPGHLGHEGRVCPFKRFLRNPDLGAEGLRFLVHLHLQAVCRTAGETIVSAADP